MGCCPYGRGAWSMTRRKRGLKLAAAAFLLLLALTGCAGATPEDLYAPPQLSERYLKLQTAINQMLASGASYAPPVAGPHRQAMQMEDLDGDGVGEVIAFFNFQGSDRPLRIYIFRQTEDGYEEAARIEGEGSGIDGISYTDMDGDGVKEIAVGWQTQGLNLLSVYTVNEFQVSQILSADYSEYTVCQLNPGAKSDILTLRLSPSERNGEATLYSLTADGEVVRSSARLSAGVTELLRVRSTPLVDGRDAILLESRLGEDGYVSDILTFRDGALTNITLSEASSLSEGTLRNPEIYCRDIDGDGVLDVPRPIAVPSVQETPYYRIEWTCYASDGAPRLTAHTYNNATDGWYFTLPEEWVEHLAVRRSGEVAGERAVIFSLVNEDGSIGPDFLAIYALTGDKRSARASSAGRFMLRSENETIYAASVLGDETVLGVQLSREFVRTRFGLIYSEWITGAT